MTQEIKCQADIFSTLPYSTYLKLPDIMKISRKRITQLQQKFVGGLPKTNLTPDELKQLSVITNIPCMELIEKARIRYFNDMQKEDFEHFDTAQKEKYEQKQQ